MDESSKWIVQQTCFIVPVSWISLIFVVNLLEFSTGEPTTEGKTPEDIKENNGKELNTVNESIDVETGNKLLTEVENNRSYQVIPFFYHKLPKSTDILAQKLREEARTLFLQKRSKELLDNNELKTLWNILQKNYTKPSINNEQFINYDDYLRIVKIAGEKFKWVNRLKSAWSFWTCNFLPFQNLFDIVYIYTVAGH